MFRRLARLALACTLAAATVTTATAGGFAAPPSAGAPMPVADRAEPDPDTAIVRMRPALSDAARQRLRAVLGKHRDQNLRAFAGYVRRGVFPHNFENDGRLNVWRDREGHLCAAATMISRSGARKLVAKVARTDNFIRLADVTEGPLLDWILTSGLTHAEVVAIQEPFMGNEPDLPARDWRTAEDARLRARYAEVRAQLAADRDASLDAAIDALALHPELVARLIGAA
ncbi:MAG: hypothetical protein IPH80_22010 [Myxococcales bacterium]|nr:hypothetical protein [Myxococcales bacterium]